MPLKVMNVELREVNLLLVLHQLPILDFLRSVLFLLTVACSLKADQRQRGLFQPALAMVDIIEGQDSLPADILPRDKLLTIQLNRELVRLCPAHLLVLLISHHFL